MIKNDLKVGKVVFVSGFNNYLGLDDDFDEVNCTMYTNRLSELKNHANERICYYSDSDPFVKFSYLEDFAKTVNAECHHVKDAGHFNHSAGYDKFEELLKYIK